MVDKSVIQVVLDNNLPCNFVGKYNIQSHHNSNKNAYTMLIRKVHSQA